MHHCQDKQSTTLDENNKSTTIAMPNETICDGSGMILDYGGPFDCPGCSACLEPVAPVELVSVEPNHITFRARSSEDANRFMSELEADLIARLGIDPLDR